MESNNFSDCYVDPIAWFNKVNWRAFGGFSFAEKVSDGSLVWKEDMTPEEREAWFGLLNMKAEEDRRSGEAQDGVRAYNRALERAGMFCRIHKISSHAKQTELAEGIVRGSIPGWAWCLGDSPYWHDIDI